MAASSAAYASTVTHYIVYDVETSHAPAEADCNIIELGGVALDADGGG